MAAASSVRSAAQVTAAGSASPRGSLARRLVALLTGHTEAARAQITLWFLRPLLWCVLVFLLLVVGLMHLYLKTTQFLEPIR
jgi:hypothetical protein